MGISISIYLLFEVLSTESSFISELMKYLGFFTALYSVFAPRGGLIIMLFWCGYLDFIKRLIVLTQGYQFMDVIDILKVAPYTFLGIIIGLISERIITRKNFYFREILIFIFVNFILGILFIKEYYYSKNAFLVLATTANNYFYVFLIFVVPLAYKSIDEIVQYIRISLFIFIPVSVYGIWQSNFGLNQFEIDYLLTGFSRSIQVLRDENPRPFSTLNSPHAFSIMWTFAAASYYFMINSQQKRWLYALFLLCFIMGVFFSYTRGSYVALVLCLTGLWVFRKKYLTFIFYGFLILSFIFIVAYAKELMDLFEKITFALNAQNNTEEKLYRFSTVSDRFKSFENLKSSPLFWQPFGNFEITKISGISERDEFFTHDALSSSLLKFGYIPISIILTILTYILYLFHSKAWCVSRLEIKNFLILAISIVVTVIFASLGGDTIHVFPWNYFFWFYMSIFFYFWCNEGKINI